MIPAINLRAARLDRGLTLREAADQMGVEFNALARAERGDGTPTPRNAFRIASFYGHKVSEVWPTPDPTEAAA